MVPDLLRHNDKAAGDRPAPSPSGRLKAAPARDPRDFAAPILIPDNPIAKSTRFLGKNLRSRGMIGTMEGDISPADARAAQHAENSRDIVETSEKTSLKMGDLPSNVPKVLPGRPDGSWL
ncbi:hypothetical protein ACIPEN_15725 [Herbaspirillum chlorophenolicum]|uniref:Uncharacterized protein n=1 Tax=Herbaspirillum chlorophenolicum TaxID=211589 RepID=A0ABW8F1W1_9BURK